MGQDHCDSREVPGSGNGTLLRRARALMLRVPDLFAPRRLDADLADELESHLQTDPSRREDRSHADARVCVMAATRATGRLWGERAPSHTSTAHVELPTSARQRCG